MKVKKENRIGAGSNTPSKVTNETKIPLKGGFATQGEVLTQNQFDANIAAKLNSMNIQFSTNNTGTPNPDILSNLSNAEWSTIGTMLNKLGKPVQGKEEAKVILNSYYGGAISNAKGFADIYNALSADYIPGLDGSSNAPKTTINLQDPAVLDTIIKGTYQSMLKRDPNPVELDARRKEVQAVIMKGQTMKKTGTNETTYTPGFTQAGAQELVKSKIEKGGAEVQTDIQQAQSIDFADFIGKLGK